VDGEIGAFAKGEDLRGEELEAGELELGPVMHKLLSRQEGIDILEIGYRVMLYSPCSVTL
jgi:hypothetical protein